MVGIDRTTIEKEGGMGKACRAGRIGLGRQIWKVAVACFLENRQPEKTQGKQGASVIEIIFIERRCCAPAG